MKYIQQFAVILMISFAGELCHAFIPFPIPSSIYGLVLMLLALQTGLIKLHQVEDTARYLIEIMPLMFIPAAVGLVDAFAVLRPVWLPFTVIMLVSTIVVMGVTGRCTQAVLLWERKRKAKGAVSDE